MQMMSTEFFLSYWDKSSINFYKSIKEKRDTCTIGIWDNLREGTSDKVQGTRKIEGPRAKKPGQERNQQPEGFLLTLVLDHILCACRFASDKSSNEASASSID